MRLSRLELEEFRLYRRLVLELPPAGLAAIGDNASGKSTLIEAIVVLATMRSPRSGSDRELINWSSGREYGFPPFARVGGAVESLAGSLDIDVYLQLNRDDGGHLSKSVKVDGRSLRVIDAVGRVKIVLFTPEDVSLVSGSPAQRRRYLDLLISQLDPRYLRSLSKYNRILEQRNSLLKSLLREGRGMGNGDVASQLSFWDDELVTYGSYLAARRMSTAGRLSAAARKRYGGFGAAQELGIAYVGNIGGDAWHASTEHQDLDQLSGLVRRRFEVALGARRNDELRRGVSLVGPHRDDLTFSLDGVDVGTYGSRGQQRLAVVALKLAESDLMSSEAGEPPMLLLDDVLSELDATNRDRLLTAVAATGAQLVLTTTDQELMNHPAIGSLPRATISGGTVVT